MITRLGGVIDLETVAVLVERASIVIKLLLREREAVAIDEIVSGVVRRVDVDDVHLAAVRVVQARQRVVVLPFDQNMARFAVVGADLFFGDFFKNRDPVFTLLFKFFRNIEPDQTVTLFRELGTQMRVFFCQFNEFFS